jgi:hypothetical protein
MNIFILSGLSAVHSLGNDYSGAGKDMNIFILSGLSAVHSLGNDYVALPYGVYIYLKQRQLSCFLFTFFFLILTFKDL